MHSASRESLGAARDRLETLLAGATADPARLGDDLFGVAALLAGNAGLRRALTDPSRTGEDKATLVRRLLAGQLSGPGVDLVAGLVRGRWAAPNDLTDAAETLGVTALLAGAERAGRLDAVEDELFRFSRTVSGNTGLRDAFSGRTSGPARKTELARSLLAGKAAPETVRLAVQAASAPRGLRTEQALEEYLAAAATRRQQLVAEVVAAVPLTEQQRTRLAASLRRIYGRDIRLNIDLDPEVVGGLRVQVAGELLDSTVLARLQSARRLLAG
jgi:F-type H+-transporting ATPase subunit delta